MKRKNEKRPTVLGRQADRQPPLRLEYWEPDQLSDNPRNWRRHPETQLSALKAVIDDVGWAGAALFNERTQRLIDGHARKKISKAQEKIPVLVGSWSEEQENKILATLDPLATLAEADHETLLALLQGVQTESEAVQALLKDLAAGELVPLFDPEAAPGLTDPDDVPALPDEATTQPGDVYFLGEHRLLCGDSSKPEDVDRLLEGASVHLVNTDPPYNVNVAPRSNNAIAAGLSSFPGRQHHPRFDLKRRLAKAKPTDKKLRAKDRPLANDFISDDEFDRLLRAWFGNLARVLAPGRAFYVWGGYANCGNYPPVLKATGLFFAQAIIWVKEHPVLTRKDYMGNHEWCFYGWREGAAHKFYGPKNAVDVWSIRKVNPQNMIHLTEKPVELAVRAMQNSSRAGERVLDLFGGSGSTLIGAEQTERRAYLMEVDPLYCDVIVRRWEKFTGKKAQVRHGQK
jgi:DNA modification methylase